MPLRIAFDPDEVLADMRGAPLREKERLAAAKTREGQDDVEPAGHLCVPNVFLMTCGRCNWRKNRPGLPRETAGYGAKHLGRDGRESDGKGQFPAGPGDDLPRLVDPGLAGATERHGHDD